jgi:hypothetical protein
MKNALSVWIGLSLLVALGCRKVASPAVEVEVTRADAGPGAEKARPVATPRVALVGTDHKETIRNVLDLAGVKLGSTVELVEREHVEHALAEQKLSLAGLVDANQVVAVGKIVGVDLFAVVEATLDGKEAIGLVVFDGRTGARLWDAALPAGGAKDTADAVAAGVRKAAVKYQGGLKPLQPLCLLGVRNADLPPDKDYLCQSLAQILERELLGSASVVVLERKRLDQWNKEKSIPTTGPAAELLASLHFLELEVRRPKEGKGVLAHVYLTDSTGKRLGDVVTQAQGSDAAELVKPLVAGTLQKLKAAPAPAAADRTREAERFLREAQLFWGHKLWKQGLQAAEAAYALDSPNPAARTTLAEDLVFHAVFLVDPNGLYSLRWGTAGPRIAVARDVLTTALRQAGRGLDVQRDDLAALKDRSRLSLARYQIRYMPARRALRSFLNKLMYIDASTPDRKVLDEFRASVDQLLLDERTAWAEGVSTHPGQGDATVPKGPQPDSFFSQYSHLLQDQFELMTWNATDGATHARAITQAGKQWLEAARKQDAKFQVWHLTWFLDSLFRTATSPLGKSWALRPEDASLAAGLFDAMAEHPYPLIALYGKCGALFVQAETKRLTPAACHQRFQPIKQEAFRLIKEPPVENAGDFRAGCYKYLAFALDNLNFGPGPAKPAEYLEVCEFMLERRELVAEVVENSLTHPVLVNAFDVKQRRQLLMLINRAMTVADDPQAKLLSGLRQAMKNKLMPAQQKLYAQFPDLAPKPAELPWEHAKVLFETSQLKDVQAFLTPIVVGDHVYVIGCGARTEKDRDQAFLRLVRVALPDGTAKELGETPVTVKTFTPGRVNYGQLVNPPFVRGIAIGESAVYVGTIGDGIYAFGPADGAVRRIAEKEGLPSAAVESLTFVAGKVYAGLAGGYLVTLDEKTKEVKVLASSRRKEKLSPFDDLASGFSVPYLVADPRRDRVLFALYENTNQDLYQTGPKKNTPAGFWELNLKTGAYTRHFRLYHYPRVGWGSGIRADHILLSSNTFALDFDLARNKPELLWAFNHVGPELRMDQARCKDYFTMNSPRLYRDGWLWSEHPFSRLNVHSKKQEYFPALGKPKDANPFSLRDIEPIGTGDRLLMANLFTLWIVTLRK